MYYISQTVNTVQLEELEQLYNKKQHFQFGLRVHILEVSHLFQMNGLPSSQIGAQVYLKFKFSENLYV